MMKFKKFLAAAMSGIMMLGTVIAAAPAVSTYAAELSVVGKDVTFTQLTDAEEGAVVWVGGKDIKANEAKKIEAEYNKTVQFQAVGSAYQGGKWVVAVTDEKIATAEAFVAKFDEKGKFDKTATADGKKKASAKIKDGVITVTAGKEAGTVYVWVYELNNKKVVKETVSAVKVDVKQASTGVVISESEVKEGVLAKGTSKVELETGAKKTLYIADKKTAVDADATFTVSLAKEDEAKYVKATYNADTKTIEIEALQNDNGKKATATVIIKNNESGKSAKVKVTVKETPAATETPTPTTAG